MTTYKRRLSLRELNSCENATTKRCECRCGGRLHGARRVKDDKGYADLPKDDPHYFNPKDGEEESEATATLFDLHK
jgi:hypothetical protein